MKAHELNRLAVWLPMKSDELDVKTQPTGYAYVTAGNVATSTEETPVIRYAKNYERHSKKFSLCLITTQSNAEAVEAWLDEQADQLEPRDIIRNFLLTSRMYG